MVRSFDYQAPQDGRVRLILSLSKDERAAPAPAGRTREPASGRGGHEGVIR